MEQNLTEKLSEAMSAFCRANLNRKSNLPIRSSEMGTLIFITKFSGDTGVKAVDISEYFGIQKSSVSTIINSLEKQNYILRNVSEEDKRSSPLFPTEKGKKLVTEAIEEYHRFSKQVIETIGIQKSEQFLEMLNKVTKVIQNGEE